MAERKPISKRTRFDVFKRDGFCCQYCGQKPPTVVLEIDHIHPVSEGGGNSKDNLITACFDCNRGKSNNLLTTMPESLQERAQFLQEKQDQLKAYSRLLKSIKKQEAEAVGGVELAFQEYYGDMSFTVKFRESVRQFLEKLPYDVVENAMHRACNKTNDSSNATKYFCGICWNIIKGKVR